MADRVTETALAARDLFDAKAAAWPSKYAPDGRLAGRLAGLAGAVTDRIPAGGSVLDLGCGTGELARVIAAAGNRVTGCDISARMLRRAMAADPAGTADWVQLDPDWTTLPFQPETFDAVMAASMLEYVADPAAVLSECRRVLRQGGVVLCTVPDQRHPVRWLEGMIGAAARVPPLPAIARRLPRLGGYLAYLRISGQRHSRRWWSATAGRAGLSDTGDLAHSSGRRTLRLLAFRRHADGRESR